MKNLFRIIGIFVLVSIISINVNAQDAKVFHGIVSLKLTAEGDLSEAEKAQVEGKIISTYGQGVYKEETSTMMYSQTKIVYKDSIIVIFDQMGQKFAFRMTKEEAESMKKKAEEKIDAATESSEEDKPKVNFIEETKEIAGHKCKKAEIVDGESIIEVFYDPDFVLEDFMQDDNFEGINGLILEYVMPLPGKEDASIHVVATTVKKKKKVKAKVFSIPSDIEVKSFNDLKALMGG